MNAIQLSFTNTFEGNLKTKNANIAIGQSNNQLLPYEMLTGALGSCLYATFLDIVKKMRLEFNGCQINITWEKRTEVPTTLEHADIQVKLNGCPADKHKKFERAFQLATEYCSIFVTLSHVAELTWTVSFGDAVNERFDQGV